MSDIRMPPSMPATVISQSTALAHFEEEKGFYVAMFASMYVVIRPDTAKQLKDSQDARRRYLSKMRRVARRIDTDGAGFHPGAESYHEDPGDLCDEDFSSGRYL